MVLNYNHLYYFHVAATEGTVSAAAARLGVTPATVSEQVRALERVLGVELFERTQTGLKLTDPGHLTFEHTATMFRLGERLMEALGQSDDTSPHRLRVGVSIGVARSITARLVSPLFSLAGCVPSVRTGDTVDLLRDLRAGALDLVLCDGEPPMSSRIGLASTVVETVPMVVIAGPDVEPADDWHNVALVHYRATISFRKDVDAFLEARGLKPRVAGEADDGLVLVESALRDGVIAIVPRSIAGDVIAAGRLRVLEQVEHVSAVHALYQDTSPIALAHRAIDAIMASSH